MKTTNLKTIITYESKLTRRNWLFYLFIIGGVYILGTLIPGVFILGIGYIGWQDVALTSSMPLRGIYFLNLFQSLIVTFLVCDIQRKRKKAETREVLLTRPISNGQTLLGEVIGILIPFLTIDIIFMTISMIINIFIPNSHVSLWINLFYLFTYTVPTLVFITSLSILVNKLVKHPMFSWLILIAFLYFEYNYAATAFYGILDFQGRLLPNSFSTLIGFMDLSNFLLHRGVFLLLGISFLYFSILLVKRLPGTAGRQRYLAVPAMLFLAFSLYLGFIYIEKYQSRLENRITCRKAFLKYTKTPKARVITHDITYHPRGNTFSATSRMQVQNQKKKKMDQLLLFLNPGLKINKIESNGQNLPFHRDHLAVVIERSLAPNEYIKLDITYEGYINEDIYQINLPDEKFFPLKDNPFSKENYGKHPAFVSSKFTFLRPEVLWYPTAVPSIALQASAEMNFTSYTLHVKKTDELTVLSQGVPITEGEYVTFNNLQNLTGLTLCIGEYEKRALTVDSLTVELYTYPGNDCYMKYFDEWDLLKEDNPNREKDLKKMFYLCKDEIEQDKPNPYPFKYFKLIEVPSSSYFLRSTLFNDCMQPEIAFFHERLCRIETRNPADYPDNNFYDRSVQEYLLTVNFPYLWNNNMGIKHIFTDYNSCITSNTYQGIELIFKQMINPNVYRSPNDIMSLELLNRIAEKGLKGIIAEEHSREQNIAIRSKVSHLLGYLTTITTWDSLSRLMQDFNTHIPFHEVNFDSFIEGFEQHFGQNIKAYMDEWYTTLEVPLLSIKDIYRKKTEDTQILDFKVGNPSGTDGIVSIIAKDPPPGKSVIRNLQSYLIKPGEYKRIVIHENIEHELQLTTNFSGCFPQDIKVSQAPVSSAIPNKGITLLDRNQFYPPGEIIVDNEDVNFHLIDSANNRKRLTDLIKKENNEKYIPFYKVKGNTWELTLSQEFHGEHIRSAFVKKAGTGKSKAEWKADIPEAGKYEIFVHRPHVCECPNGIFYAVDYPETKNYYTVYTPEGEKEIVIETQEADYYVACTLPLPAEEAWVSLGTFTLPAGESRVVLDDRGIASFKNEKFGQEYAQLIAADAVKWVKKK
ncbi:hypothetical protein [Butyricimonas sp.]|uniref:hypothetical protein n=1 Tax=Butyricimonas sp. TaxID=1969738 RepID=UPI0025C60074|nr:hypothetical protein [Butyricimonas sp.]